MSILGHVSLWVHAALVLRWIPRSGFLGYKIAVCLFFIKCGPTCPKWWRCFTFLPILFVPLPHDHLVLPVIFVLAILKGGQLWLECAYHWWVMRLRSILPACPIHIFFSKTHVHVFAHFYYGLCLYYSAAEEVHSLYILNINLWSNGYFVNISPKIWFDYLIERLNFHDI